MRKIIICLILIHSFLVIQAQVEFEYQENLIDKNNSAVAVCVSDMNHDGLDDVAYFYKNDELILMTQKPFGEFYETTIGRVPEEPWFLLSWDWNEDGEADFISGGRNEIFAYLSQNQSYELRRKTIEIGNVFLAQAANLINIDEDAAPEIFICNDVDSNFFVDIIEDSFTIIKNKFVQDIDASGIAGNYGSTWEFIDEDLIPDLYISKCFQTASERSDPRRHNLLYLSEGDYQWEDQAEKWGLKDSAQSWASSFADVDNDGDMDVLVLNHDAPSYLYVNEGNAYKAVEAIAGNSNLLDLGIQIIAEDINNDKYVDFFISGSRSYVLLNNQDGTFREISQEALGFYDDKIATISAGDFNLDGKVDFFRSQHILYNRHNTSRNGFLYNNSKNDNHFVQFNLVDDELKPISNLVRIELYSGGDRQLRTYRQGESYGIMRSRTIHFGLGEDTQVDSIIVYGQDFPIQKYYNLEADRQYLIYSDNEIWEVPKLEANKNVACIGDTITVHKPIDTESGSFYLYNDQVWLNADSVVLRNSDGVYYRWREGQRWRRSLPLRIRFDPAIDSRIDLELDILCNQMPVTAEVDPLYFQKWSNGSTEASIEISDTQQYYAIFDNGCRVVNSDTFQLELKQVLQPLNLQSLSVPLGQDVTLDVGIDSAAWYLDSLSLRPFFVGRNWTIPNIQGDTTFYISRATFENVAVYSGGESIEQELRTESNFNFSGIRFDALVDIRIQSFQVESDTIGHRIFWLRDQEGTLILEKEIFIEQGVQEVFLNWTIPRGNNYVLTTDRRYNLDTWGSLHPQLRILPGQATFPYEIKDLMTIQANSGGHLYYPYFFDLQVSEEPEICESERMPLHVRVTSKAVDRAKESIVVFPNPASSIIHLQNYLNWEELRVYNSLGVEILHFSAIPNQIDVSNWADGIYFLECADGRERQVLKVIKHD